MWPLLILYLLFHPANAQFAEIASLATSLLGSGLGPALGGAAAAGSAAAPGLGALSQIGQLYQLAQGALQLTGTGVGVLNQASEGNWFPAVLEQASKNTKTIMGGAGRGFGGPPNLGPLGPMTGVGSGSQIGPEFGTGFPAPNIEDYTDNTDKTEAKTTTKATESLVNIDDNDFDEVTSAPAPTAPPTPTVPVTLFPDESESNSVTEPTSAAPLKEIRIELPKSTGESTDSDYIDQVTTDGDSRVQVTNKSKNDEDENLLVPERASAAKTLNAKVRTGVPDLTKLIDVLRKSNLKESEIMEIVSQVEGNENVAKPPRIDFTSAVQNIPLKKHLNRERIAKASRELQRSIEPHEKVIEAHFNNLRQVPDLAATVSAASSTVAVAATTATPSPTLIPQVAPNPKPDFVATNRLQREISSVPAEKAPVPQPTPPPTPSLLLPQAQFTTPPNYFLHQWHHPQFPVQPHPLYQPQPFPQQQPTVHPLFQPNPYQQFPYQQYHLQQPYGQQVQNPLHPLQQQPQPAPAASPVVRQQTQQVPQQPLQQQVQQQQLQQQQPIQHQQFQQQQQQQYYSRPQASVYPYQQPYPQQAQQYSTQQQVVPPQQQQYRQFRQVSGQAYTAQGQPVIYTNQPPGTPPQFSKSTYVAHSAPTQQGNMVAQQAAPSSHIATRSVHPGSVLSSQTKTRGAGYTSQRLDSARRPPAAHGLRVATVSSSPQLTSSPVRKNRDIVTPRPNRRYPVRTARTQRITTPAPVRAAAGANQLLH